MPGVPIFAAHPDKYYHDGASGKHKAGEEVVAKVYIDTPQKVWHLAAKNVEAHLIRLCDLGRVQQNGMRYLRCAFGDEKANS